MLKISTLKEIRSLILEIEDLSGVLEYQTKEKFWKVPKYLDPMLILADRLNQVSLTGNLPRHAAPRVFWDLCQSRGFYPIKIDTKRMMFIHYGQLQDIRDELKSILKKETNDKIQKAKAAKDAAIQIAKKK